MIELIQITKTNRGTLHLPAIAFVEGDDQPGLVGITFNWVSFEEPVEIISSKLEVLYWPDEGGGMTPLYIGEERIFNPSLQMGQGDIACWNYPISEALASLMEISEGSCDPEGCCDTLRDALASERPMPEFEIGVQFRPMLR